MTGGARVLVADDEASIRFVLRETIEEEGCRVVDVDNGDTALEELASGEFELYGLSHDPYQMNPIVPDFCGIGFELALFLPPIMWAYGRHRRPIVHSFGTARY